MKKLAIITTHPIQYYAPVFKLLSERNKIELKVFYTGGEQMGHVKYDPGFKQIINWDIPLLTGYDYEFLKNISKTPGTSTFRGIINPHAITKIAAYQPDAILVYGWANYSHLKILNYFKSKKPLFFRGDSTLLDQQNTLKQFLRSLFLKWVYRKVDKVLYVGSANKAYFKEYGVRQDNLIFAPHAIDNDRFSEPKTSEVNYLRTLLDLKADDILILFAGKLEPKKNPGILLDAFVQLNRSNVHLLFVGNGALENDLKMKSRGIARVKQIHFMNFQNQQAMPIIYQACDIFCLPSQGPGETWGLAVNEAMACKKAVIVSDKVGCHSDLVKDTRNGTTFTNYSDLMSKLSLLTRSRAALKQMGEQSFEIIGEWTFERQAEAIEMCVYNY